MSVIAKGSACTAFSKISASASSPKHLSLWLHHRVIRPPALRRRLNLQAKLGSLTTAQHEINNQASFDAACSATPVVVVDWMAKWCRKCIALKPKLEKLVQDDFPGVSLIFIDVNAVPGDVVKGAGITKMPTVQVFHNGSKVYEVVGTQSPLEVVEEVRLRVRNVLQQTV